MTKVTFQETEAAHADRLGVARNFVRVRRRVLSERLGGPVARDRRGDNIPERVRQASTPALLVSLQVQVAATNRQTSRGEAVVLLTPLAGAIPEELRRGQALTALRAMGTVRLGGAGLPRRKLNPPYGYQRAADGQLLPDPQDGPAVVEAFRLIAAGADRAGRVSWVTIAEQLNHQGWRRQRGQLWGGDDVRDLTEVTTYAGYVRRNWRAGRTGAAELIRATAIPQPLIDPLTFLQAARLGRGRGTQWLLQLAAHVADQPAPAAPPPAAAPSETTDGQ